MAPRRYNLGKRAALKEETRRRIVEATFELHGEKGVVATSMQDVADRADVALHTVYRNFPTVDDLVNGCAERVKSHILPPGPEVFARAPELSARIRVLVREMFAMHERGSRMMQMARCQQEEVPALATALRSWAEHHEMMVDEALRPANATRALRREVLALTDFYAWKSFNDAGVSTRRAIAIVTELIQNRTPGPAHG